MHISAVQKVTIVERVIDHRKIDSSLICAWPGNIHSGGEVQAVHQIPEQEEASQALQRWRMEA